MSDMDHMNHIEAVAAADVAALREKEKTYQGSWKRRGGVGAFMMLARKWDRLESMLQRWHPNNPGQDGREVQDPPYDVFAHVAGSPGGEDGTPLAEIRDLRRYLTLVEAEMISRGCVKIPERRKPTVQELEEILKQNDDESVLVRREGSTERRVPRLSEERLEDGGAAYDPSAHFLSWFCSPGMREKTQSVLVDRRRVPQEKWEHLPRLAVELNSHEFRTTLRPEYRGLYEWRESESKHVMLPQYRECWGRLP